MIQVLQQDQSSYKIETISKKKRINCSKKTLKYNVVSYQMRVKLIKLASSKGYSISRASRQLGIKVSTGKFIVKSFRDSGKIMNKSGNFQNKLISICEQESSNETQDQKDEQILENGKINNFELQRICGVKVENSLTFPVQGSMLMGLNYNLMEQVTCMAPIYFYQNFGQLNGMIFPIFQ